RSCRAGERTRAASSAAGAACRVSPSPSRRAMSIRSTRWRTSTIFKPPSTCSPPISKTRIPASTATPMRCHKTEGTGYPEGTGSQKQKNRRWQLPASVLPGHPPVNPDNLVHPVLFHALRGSRGLTAQDFGQVVHGDAEFEVGLAQAFFDQGHIVGRNAQAARV